MLDSIEQSLFPRNSFPSGYAGCNRLYAGRLGLDRVRQRVRSLNARLASLDGIKENQYFEPETPLDWLFYDEEHEVIPIYSEGISVVSQEYILPPSEIPFLLDFMRVSGTKNAVEVENHGKGYHFHYGKIRGSALRRYDVVLTFDKQKSSCDLVGSSGTPLFSEAHSSRKYPHIDISTVGNNKRRPIYLVCADALESRGLENFRQPAFDARQFYPAIS